MTDEELHKWRMDVCERNCTHKDAYRNARKSIENQGMKDLLSDLLALCGAVRGFCFRRKHSTG